MSEPASPQLTPFRKFAERKGVSTKTLERWTAAGILPEPIRIRGRKYFPADVEPRHDDDTRAA
jgi:predicted site-specific integrase-resolvase